METLHIYAKDLRIAKAIINHDEGVTRQFFYKECYPIFKFFFDYFCTDCETCLDFIHEIYAVVLTPGKKTGKCQMENFRGESTLKSWIKSACIFYCRGKFEMKQRMPMYEPVLSSTEEKEDVCDIFDNIFPSSEIDLSGLEREDIEKLLAMMPNKRYSQIIRLHYLEQKTHQETAEALGMTMKNYYNKRKLAVEQYNEIFRKEGKYGK